MITLQEASEIAKAKFEIKPSSTIRLDDVCRDIGDAWVFMWRRKENPDMLISGGRDVRIEKEDGKASWFYMTVDNNYEVFAAGKEVDISEFV